MVEAQVVRGQKVLVARKAMRFDEPAGQVVGAIRVSMTATLNHHPVACVEHLVEGLPVVRWYRLEDLTVVRS